MVTIRAPQMIALTEVNGRRFIAEMQTHLRGHFPARVAQMSTSELDAQIVSCLARAERYRLISRRDAYRFLNLAAAYGWGFDNDPALPWMRRYLEDTGVSTPSDRIEALVRHCIHRQQVEAGNVRIREEMALSAMQSAQANADRNSPGLSDLPDHAVNQPDALLRAGVRSAESSHALDMPEAIGNTHPPELAPWTEDTHPLLRR